MTKEDIKKQVTAILYKHTCHVDMHINEIDYEEVVVDLVKLFTIPHVVQQSELLMPYTKYLYHHNNITQEQAKETVDEYIKRHL